MRLGPGLVAAACSALAACGSPIAVAPIGPHASDDPFVIVPYPPPPARVEIVQLPKDTSVDKVWVDGEWEWRGRRWTWKPGQWQLPQPGAHYAPSVTVRLVDGSLAWFAGGWKVTEK